MHILEGNYSFLYLQNEIYIKEKKKYIHYRAILGQNNRAHNELICVFYSINLVMRETSEEKKKVGVLLVHTAVHRKKNTDIVFFILQNT